MSDVLGACMDQWRDSVTSERQTDPKGSRERHAELCESTRGDGMSSNVPKDDGEVRSLTKRVRGLVTRRNREVVDFMRYRVKNNTEVTNLEN